jgi:DNA-binding NtrC family response regulator
MVPAPRLLLIEDDASLSAALRSVLSAEGYQVEHALRGDDGLLRAEKEEFDAVLTDLRIPGMGGLEVVRRVHERKPILPIVLMTAHGTTETAIQATKLGAFDYLLKPFEMEELLDLLGRAVASSRMAARVVDLGEFTPGHDAIVGKSRGMQMVYKDLGRIAARPVTVLIRGETGTGKELIARAIYQHSDRSKMPFIAVNCAAIPENLLESELFGHERGAFTGAVERRIGRFEQANSGTLFLDEIGEMGASTQAKLLRVLEERLIQRLGGRETLPVDVRVIAATHVDLEQAIVEKRFREDLFYRLNQVTIHLPPLRDRREDIPPLVTHFLAKHGTALGVPSPSILPDALEQLRTHAWPGNVRELENLVRLALLRLRGYPVTVEIVRDLLAAAGRPRQASHRGLAELVADELASAQRGEEADVHGRLIEMMEREAFGQAIALAGGNQAKAARWLGVSRVTMREKLRHFGLRDVGDGLVSEGADGGSGTP